MVILSDNNKSNIFEIDSSIFEETKNFLKKLTKSKKSSFSYIDDLGDKIVVIDGKEFVEPTKEDIEAIFTAKDKEFLDESEAKKLLDV